MTNPSQKENIRFNVLRNALYHTARRRVLERWTRIFNFAIVVLGTVAVGDVLELLSIEQSYVGFAVAIIGALQLVFDFGRQARDHQGLQRDYYSLLADIDADIADDEAKHAEWCSRMVRITGDEPPTLRAHDAKAYNDAVDAMELPRDQRLHIPLWHRLLGDFSAFEGYQYKKFAEFSND